MMTIRITKQPSGFFAFLEGHEMLSGAGSTPQKAVERLMASAPHLFGSVTLTTPVATVGASEHLVGGGCVVSEDDGEIA